VIVGAGLPNDVEQKMNKHNTIYLGEIHDPENIKISKIFKMADVFSIPGHIGLGVNEAFYWGLPVVTEDGKQPPEINYIVNGRNGFIVPENDKQELMRMIMYLIRNDDIRKDYSDKAKQDILRNASVDRMYTGFLNCLEYVKRKFKIS
jgi:glycosyltransferase involved in cell wall biosynthesis